MHSVGDIVFIVSNKKRQVFPVQVVEQVIRKTLEGEQVTYKVKIPGADTKPVDLHAIDGTVHLSLKAVREFLYSQATSAIDEVVSTAQELCASFGGEPDNGHVTEAAAHENGASNKVKVKLSDGTSATVTLPDVQ
jgi:hypothetical protein